MRSFDRRRFLAGSTAALVIVPVHSSGVASALHPEDFGAVGDGATNDTAAFTRLSAEINHRKGGAISLRTGATYVVGAQSRRLDGWGWKPEPIVDLRQLRAPLTILGNGARLLAQPGLRFGTFDLQSGKPVHHELPYVDPTDLAAAYDGMIAVRNCAADVVIRDLELDGNLPRLRIGGKFGDVGWQVPATGLLLVGNLGSEIVQNVHTHDHAQDGAMLIGDPKRAGRTSVSRLLSRRNGRQALSITGGRGFDFADSEFSHSGRGPIRSAPSAGLDIEAESAQIRDLTFVRCKFVDNAGCGLVADSGDAANARFTDCRFVGTTNWSAWPNKPGFRFERCVFVGSVVHPFSGVDPSRAVRFTSCTFTDERKLSPTGKVFTGGGPIVNLATSDNVLFDRCRFRLVADGTLPWSWKAIYRSCAMSQASRTVATPKGRYLGHTAITAPVDLYGSMIEGTVILNGHPLPYGPIGVKRW